MSLDEAYARLKTIADLDGWAVMIHLDLAYLSISMSIHGDRQFTLSAPTLEEAMLLAAKHARCKPGCNCQLLEGS